MVKTEENSTDNNKVRVLIVDDHSIVRKGLSQMINAEPDLVACAEAEDAEHALEVMKTTPVDLAIVDISLVGTDGVQLTREIKSEHPHLPVLILTMHDELFHAERAFRAGAGGYITKNEAAETIITAIHMILGGKEYLGETMRQRFQDRERSE
jgi:DNA-binding NarL/FixJ family response regulator